MIKGIGIDICELKRIEAILQKQPKFVNRILTDQEKLYLEELTEKRKVEFLAGRFAAKEAFSKARGTGIGSDLSFLDIEIHKDEKGKPFIFKPQNKGEIAYLSISHSKDYAVAQVIIESSSS